MTGLITDLAFVSAEYFPGYEDGTDMYGVAARRCAYREPLVQYAGLDGEPTRGNVEDAMIATLDARRAEKFEDLDADVAAATEMFEVEDFDDACGEHTPLLVREAVEVMVVATSDGEEPALPAKVGLRCAAVLVHGWDAFMHRGSMRYNRRPNIGANKGNPKFQGRVRGDSWKRHRPVQYGVLAI